MYGCIFEISLVYHALSVFSYIDQWTCVWTASLLRLLQLKRCFILFDMAYSFYTPYKTYQNQIFEWRFNFVLYLASPSGVAKNVTLKKYCHLDIDLSIREIHRPYEFYIEALCILICFALSRVIRRHMTMWKIYSKCIACRKYYCKKYKVF